MIVIKYLNLSMDKVVKHNKDQDRKQTSVLTPTLEERLKIIANLIIDRIIEDQQNGNLRLKNQTLK